MNVRVAIGNDAVQSNLVEIWSFELQHLANALLVDLVRSITNFLSSAIGPSEPSLDELFAIFIEQVESVKVRAGRDLDQLGKTVSDLCLW